MRRQALHAMGESGMLWLAYAWPAQASQLGIGLRSVGPSWYRIVPLDRDRPQVFTLLWRPSAQETSHVVLAQGSRAWLKHFAELHRLRREGEMIIHGQGRQSPRQRRPE